MDQQDIHYALAKQVPDLKSRGCLIGTSYGSIDIPAGWLADRLADHLERMLQTELLYLVREAQHANPF